MPHRPTTIHVSINTYNRPELLKELLQDIFKEDFDFDVHIINDGSEADYSFIKDFNVNYYTVSNHGKKKYWGLINMHLQFIKESKCDYYFFLPDDIRLEKNFFKEAIRQYNVLDNPICLNLNLIRKRIGKSQWGGIIPKLQFFGGDIFYHADFCDLLFMSQKRMFEKLDFYIKPISQKRWVNNPLLGSGVGQQISERLRAYKMYQVTSSLVKQKGNTTSKMNPEARKVHQVYESQNDKIVAGMATIPQRKESLKKVVDSIIDQVHELHIYLNNYGNTIPDFLYHPRITLHKKKDMGDIGKFFTAHKHHGYFFSIDDDIIYPPNYVNDMIGRLEEFDRKYIITMHGANVGNVKRSFYGEKETFHCKYFVKTDVVVDVGGTGVMCFHTDTFCPDILKFDNPNMSDIYVGIQAKQKKVPIVVLKHKEGYIQTIKHPYEIYRKFRNKDKIQTLLVKKYF